MSTPRSWTWREHENFGKTWRGHGHEKTVKRDMNMVTINLGNVAWTLT